MLAACLGYAVHRGPPRHRPINSTILTEHLSGLAGRIFEGKSDIARED